MEPPLSLIPIAGIALVGLLVYGIFATLAILYGT
jgi:hypothetical protein